MRVSVIIPTFDRYEVLRRAVISVTMQTVSPHEIIIVDDQSSSDISPFLHDLRVRIIRPGQKLYSNGCRNLGAEAASGDFVAYLDSDDYWQSDHLQTKLDFIESNDVDAVWGNYALHQDPQPRIKDPFPLPPTADKLMLWVLSRSGDTCTSSLVSSKRAAHRVQWDPKLRKHQDWDLALTQLAELNIGFDPHCTVVVDTTDTNQLSRSTNPDASTYFLNKHHRQLGNTAKAALLYHLFCISLLLDGYSPVARDYLIGLLRRPFSAYRYHWKALARLLMYDLSIGSYKTSKRC